MKRFAHVLTLITRFTTHTQVRWSGCCSTGASKLCPSSTTPRTVATYPTPATKLATKLSPGAAGDRLMDTLQKIPKPIKSPFWSILALGKPPGMFHYEQPTDCFALKPIPVTAWSRSSVQNFPNDSTCRLLFARMPWRQWSKGVTVHLALSEAGTCASLYVLYKDIILEKHNINKPKDWIHPCWYNGRANYRWMSIYAYLPC